jgi:hypothetical protein
MLPTRKLIIITCCLIVLVACGTAGKSARTPIPYWLKGRFADDYGIQYIVSDTMFFMVPSAKYHIIEWNEREQYLLTKNDRDNPTEKGLFTRIDYMKFEGMQPYVWGFCLTVYDAADVEAARKAPQADRDNPKKGCNGFPFSRMKKITF